MMLPNGSARSFPYNNKGRERRPRSVLGINVGYLIGGIVIVEMVFSYPGLGRLTILAPQNRNVPLIQACTLTMSAIYILASFVTETVHLLLNPRLREAQ